MKLDTSEDSREYEVEAICDSAVYARELAGHLPGLYYLVSWKSYLKKENTWKPILAVQHLRKLISSFHKDHSNKPTAISKAINTAPPMARPIIKPAAKPTIRLMALKQKQGQPPGVIALTNKLKRTELHLVVIVFLAFFEVRVIHTLKRLAWKSRDFFLTNLTIETAIYQSFYPSKILSFRLQPHLWDLPLSIAASLWFFSLVLLLD